MMKVARALLILAIGAIAIYRLNTVVDDSFIGDVLVDLPLAIIALVIIIAVVKKDRKEYRQTRKRISFLASFTLVLATATFFTIYIKLLNRDRSPVILEGLTRDISTLRLELRKDGTYRITEHLFGERHYRGTYTMRDSIIQLSGADAERHSLHDRLLIAKNRNTLLTYLYPIDKEGKTIPNKTRLQVISEE